ADYDRDGFIDLFVTNGRGSAPFHNGPSQIMHNLGNGNHWLEIDLEGIRSNRDAIGAEVLATANGMTQMRYQGGGMHRFSQNHSRIHFGLAGNTTVDTVTVNWPSGITQTINNLPADEIVHILEPSFPALQGKPGYQPGQDAGLYLWKDTFDGPYHIDTNGDGAQSVFSVELITDQPIVAVTSRSLELNDSLAWSGSHLTLDSRVSTWIDGVDVQLPPGTKAVMAVEQDGRPNPRQLHIGASGQPLTPSGWIVEADTLPAPPPFQGGQDLGLFIGRDAASGELRARWNGDGPKHRAELELLFSQAPNVVTPVGFEANDVFTATANAVSIDSYVGTWWDGANIDVLPGTRLGLAYTQDGLVQPHRVNPATRNLGLPNAYSLPRAEPYGKPVYDPGTEAGLYLWQDQATGTWHLRGAAGGGGGRYTGEIVSDQAFTGVSAVSIEANDVLDTTDPMRIVFDLGMWNQWEDGLDFQAAPGAQLTLNLTAGSPFANPAQAVRVGNLKWPVDNLPLELGGW
ncbi:MAG: ASPIC/UnbV domain-containing protein, partial [Gammaproteobacteria bacterium]